MTKGREKGISRRARLIAAAAAAIALALPAGASGATITVNTAADEHLDPGPETGCALREAISSVNFGQNFGGCMASIIPDDYGTNDTVTVPAGTYTLTRSGVNEEMNSFGDLDVTREMTIDGVGNPTITQTFMNAERILDVPGVGDSLVLNGLTISGGLANGPGPPFNQGGNILFRGDSLDTLTLNTTQVLNGVANNSGGRGGGIKTTNGADVEIQAGSSIEDNVAGGTGAGFGGGIDMEGSGGSLTVTNSEISSNDANFNSGGTTQGFGGGIFFGAGGTTTITLTDAIIDENRAAGGTGRGAGTGGGIAVDTSGANTLTAAGGQITDNTAGGGSGWTGANESAGFGGGMDYSGNTGSSASLDDVAVVNNEAGGNDPTGTGKGSGHGAGIRTDSDLTVEDSSVSANLAGTEPAVVMKEPDLTGSGGGIQTVFNADADLTITDSSLNSNVAGDNIGLGGAIDMSSAGNLSITDSTISGNAAGSSAAGGGAQGGGIYRIALMGAPADAITRTVISANTTAGKGGGPTGTPQGAGVYASTIGSLGVFSSTIANNTATGLNGNPNGGGLYLDSNMAGPAAIYDLVNSTISGNTATSAANDGANGGGIAVAGSTSLNSPSVTLTHVTVAGNTASTDTQVPIDSGLGGNLYLGVESGLDLFDLRATIIAGGTAGAAGTANCGLAVMGAIDSLGENVEQTMPTQCELDGPGDQVGANPMLDLLNPSNGGSPNNGIPAATRALLAGSPAIDSVPTAGCPATDQRGVTRAQGTGCDAGAFEVEDADGDGLVSTDNCPAQAGPASNGGCPASPVTPTTPPASTPTTAPAAAPKAKKCKKKKKKAAGAAKKCKRKKK